MAQKHAEDEVDKHGKGGGGAGGLQCDAEAPLVDEGSDRGDDVDGLTGVGTQYAAFRLDPDQ